MRGQKIKLIAIGNKLMGDDGLALYVAESLLEYLYANNIEVIIGETDIEYCIDKIDEGDFIILIDSSLQRKAPGEIHTMPLDEVKIYSRHCFSLHQPNLIKYLDIYKIHIHGILVSIEAAEVAFRYGLSDSIKECYPGIIKGVTSLIDEIREGYYA